MVGSFLSAHPTRSREVNVIQPVRSPVAAWSQPGRTLFTAVQFAGRLCSPSDLFGSFGVSHGGVGGAAISGLGSV
jgi:hypothetical protein